MASEMIRVRGASEHNLKNLDLDLPRGLWIAVTGPSGSGKSSLVFDTLVRESERRFMSNLSGRARHFYGKLGRVAADEIRGLPVSIAVGQKATTPNTRSTVGTLTGLSDLMRLVFARAAESPDANVKLTRSHFSFNHPLGQCGACSGSGLEDRVDPARIVADPAKSLREGALVPTLKNGYTVYSQVTLEVMDQICRAHGFDVETPWQELTGEQRAVILYGTQKLKVPFGKHSIESRMKWEGITARPREEGYYRGLVPVIEETLQRNRNPNILRFVSSCPCSACGGSRLGELGRSAKLGDFTFPEVLSTPIHGWSEQLNSLPAAAVLVGVRHELDQRVERLVRLGLGHLAPDRVSTSLSGGEAQRVRLAAQLSSGLRNMLFALDEPTLGLHPEDQEGMRAVLDELVERGNSLIVCEHDPDMVRHADHVVELGPGAGTEGGRVVATDIPNQEASGPRLEHPLGRAHRRKTELRPEQGLLRIEGATLHNLDDATLELALGTLNVVMGPSGAGKSSLVFQTLLPALEGKPGGPFHRLTRPDSISTQAVDARPIGKTSRSTPATWSGLFDLIRKRFAKTADAEKMKLTASHFSFNTAKGRCENCEGLGTTRIGMHVFDDVELVCDTCGGDRYAPAVLQARLEGKSIADILRLTFREATEFFAEDASIASLCDAMLQLGLGYLTLGQSSGSLSRGESQRIKLATLLGSKRKESSTVFLDEPDRGLSPTDIAALLTALDALVHEGHTVICISHHRQVWAAADRLIEVRGGVTKIEPQVDWSERSERRSVRGTTAAESPLHLRGVRTHNLRDVDVALPTRKLTGLCGVSGSGKSSLAFDTLCSESERRFAESLPFQVRRFLKRRPRASLESASGLTPVLNLQQQHAEPNSSSTVATLSGCGPILRLLFARAGVRDGLPCELSASHFSRERSLGACPECGGQRVQRRCDSARLITHPERPLAEATGALSGTRPGKFFSEPEGQYVAILCAALSARSTPKPLHLLQNTPWQALPPHVRELALLGSGDERYRVKWRFASKSEGEGRHEFESSWPGFCSLVEKEANNRARSKRAAEWAAPLAELACASCAGTGLAAPARETRWGKHSLPDLESMPLSALPLALQETQDAAEALSDAAESANSILPDLEERIADLIASGLGHLALGRSSTTLSKGELQRLRLASALRSGLTGVTLVLDEPTSGLHERDIERLIRRARAFRDEGNTVVLVSHRPSVLRAMDHLVEFGPGAGEQGGKIVAEGSPKSVLSGTGPTAIALRSAPLESTAKATVEFIQVRGAHVHNLQQIDFQLPSSGLVCISGVSGSGKSTLAFEVLQKSLAGRTAIGCQAIDVPGGFERYVAIHDARAQGRGSTVLTALDLAKDVASLFADSEHPARAFVPGNAAGRCNTCKGSGREHVAMDFLADLNLDCEGCGGTGFREEILLVRWRGKSIAEVLALPAATLHEALKEGTSRSERRLAERLEALEALVVSHIPVGAARRDLSGGESLRVGLASCLLHEGSPAAYFFDEPSSGLHEADLAKLSDAFRRLSDRGDLVVATEHRLSLLRAADWVIDLGPEGGPEGGRLIDQGRPKNLTLGATAAALRALEA